MPEYYPFRKTDIKYHKKLKTPLEILLEHKENNHGYVVDMITVISDQPGFYLTRREVFLLTKMEPKYFNQIAQFLF